MKLYSFLFLILPLINNAQAFAPAYDTNCLEKAKEKNLIKHYYTDEDWLRRYDFEKIKDNFHQTQDKVSKQIKAWKEISKEHYCLEDVSGIQFVDNKLVITDYDKYESFRLNKSRIDCDTDVNSFGFKPKDKPYQEYVNPNDNTTVIRDNKNVSTAKNKIENPDENLKKRQEQADKVDGLVKVLKDLGDVGFDNYCAHQLYKGGIADRIESVTKSFNNCKKAADNGDKDYINKSCGNYPSFFVGKLEELDRIAKSTEVDLGRDTSQPLFMVNEMDNKIYAKFKNNLDELKRAKEEANNEYEELLKIKNFKKHTNCDPDSPWMKSVSDGYSSSECYYSPAIFGQNDLELTDHKNILKYKHRNDMIEEVNHNIFKQTMMAKFYTLSDTEQKDVLSLVKTNPKGACEKMLPDPSAISKLFKDAKEDVVNSFLFNVPKALEEAKRKNRYSHEELKQNLCADQVRNSNGRQIKSNYLDFFKEGLKEVAANPNSSFLQKDSLQVQQELNAQITVLESLCQLKYKLRFERTTLGIDSDEESKFYKNLIAQKMQKTIDKLKQSDNSRYLLSKTLGSKFKFDSYNPAYETCESDRHFRYSPDENLASNKIELKDIEEAKEEFVDAIDKQLLSVINRTDSYRGDNKNALAEMACWNSAKHAEDNFAIYQMYKSHPYFMGQMLTHQDSSVSSVKQAILCEAIECDETIDKMNRYIVEGARYGAMALSVVPGAGTAAGVAIIAGINIAAGSFELYDKWKEGVVDSQLMMSGAATDGYGNVEDIFNNSIDSLLAEKQIQGDNKNFMIDMSTMITTEVISALLGAKAADLKVGPTSSSFEKAIGSAVGKLDKLKATIGKEFATKMGKTALTEIEQQIVDSLVGSFAQNVVKVSGEIAKGELDAKDLMPTSSKDFVFAASLLLSNTLNNKVNNLKVKDLNTTSNIIDFVVGEISSDGEEETIIDEPLYKFAKSELDNRKDFLKKVFNTDN